MNRTSLSLRATRRTRSRSFDTPCPAPRPGRVSLAVFPSGRPLPSTTSAPGCPGLFGGFAGSTGLSDFPCSSIKGLPPQRSPHGPPSADTPPREPSRTGHHQRPRATTGSPGSRAWSSSCVPGFSDRAGPTSDSRKRRQRCCLPHIEKASAPWSSLEFSRLNSPARTPPVNASLRPHGTPTHDSGPPQIANPSM